MPNKRLLVILVGITAVALGAGIIATVSLAQERALARRDGQLTARLTDADARLTASAAEARTNSATTSSLAGQQHINAVDLDDLTIQVEGIERKVDAAGSSSSDLAASAQLSNTLRGLQGDISDICTYLKAIDDPSTQPILLC